MNRADPNNKYPYYTHQWRRLRKVQLANEPLCRACCKPANTVDHIIPINKGGEIWDMENMQSLCGKCHSLKTNAEMGYKVKEGCSADGMPQDQTHWWNK